MKYLFTNKHEQLISDKRKAENEVKKLTSTLIKTGDEVNLYKTIYDDFFWLNPKKYLDREIINTGIFENQSTNLVKRLIKKGDVVLDIGANIGYYTVILSKLVGTQGKVYAFEPTLHYGKFLEQNIKINNIENCTILDYGLSDKEACLAICIGESSATLHWVVDFKPHQIENIKLTTLDKFVIDNNIDKIDFIKIDIDGHEPAFLRGASEVLSKMKPIILLEVNHENYLHAGVTAWDFYDLLKNENYFIYSEDNLIEYKTKREFLMKCGNFAYSANILICKNKIVL